MTRPRVQILILNWNGSEDTIECLESVFALDYPNFRVVVCDNASNDGSMDRLRAWAARRGAEGRDTASLATVRTAIPYVLHGRLEAEAGGGAADGKASVVFIQSDENRGFAGGNNIGLRYLLARDDADYVLLLNNDTVLAPSALSRLVAQKEVDQRVAAVGATLLEYHAPDTVQDIAGANYSPWHGMVTRIGHATAAGAPRAQPPRLDYISGCCLLVGLDTVAEVGLLDERFFMYGEDADWCTRMRARGGQLAYAPDAEVWHKGGSSSIPGSPSHEYHNVKSSLLLIHKHHPRRLAVALVYSLYRCLLPKIVRRQWRRLGAVVRAYRDVYSLVRRRTPAPPDTRAPLRAADRVGRVSAGAAS